MAPGQIEGRPVDGRADEYALACAAFELLTGAPPFQRDEAMAVMYAQLSEPAPALTSRRRDLPFAADPVFAKALAKAPADRYGSCREFSDAVRAAFGIRPYDSGPSELPSGEHPATQVVTAADAGAGGGPAPGGYARQGAGQGGHPGQGGYPGPGYAGQGAGQGGDPGRAAYQGQGAHQGQGPGQGQGGPSGPGVAGGPVLGAGAAGGHGTAETKIASRGRQTAPDLTSAQWQPGGPAGYGPYGGADPQASIPRPWGKSPLALVAAGGVLIRRAPAAHARTQGAGGGVLTRAGFRCRGGGTPGVGTAAGLTHDGHYLLVAANNGIQVLDAQGAESGASNAIVGQLTVPGSATDRRAIAVAVTPDGKFAFVSLQHDNKVGVFNLGKALSSRNYNSDYLGSLNVGSQPVGLTMSPDGKTLYATNFVEDSPVVPGELTVVDVARATNGQFKAAVMTQVHAGCNPARGAVTADGKTVWVTDRQSNYLLGYSAALLRSDPGKALKAKVHVGQTPIGIMLVKGGSLIIVADNDRVPPQPP